MAKRDKLKLLATDMFIENGMTAKAIADTLNVTEKTVSKWRQDGDWDTRRDEVLASPHKIREILLKELKSVAEGNKAAIDTDALCKIAKVMDTMSDKLSPQLVISVLKAFDNWMADNEPAMAVKFLQWHKLFIHHTVNLHAG